MIGGKEKRSHWLTRRREELEAAEQVKEMPTRDACGGELGKLPVVEESALTDLPTRCDWGGCTVFLDEKKKDEIQK